MPSQYNTSSWRDDFELDGVHPTIAHAIHDMHAWHAADVAARRAAQAAQQAAPPWPFPAQLIPPDRRTPPPRHPDPEEAPW